MNSHTLRSIGAAALALGLVAVSDMARASIVDFQVGVAGSCYEVNCPGVQGFDFSFVSGGWGVTNDANPFFNYNASGGIAGAHLSGNGAPPTLITMVKTGGGTFDLGSLDAATGWAGFVGPTDIELIGTLFGGGTVMTTLVASSTWDSYTLTGFSNLTQLVFRNNDAVAGISIDNLNSALTTAVPEPGSLALVGLGVLGLGAVRRRRAA